MVVWSRLVLFLSSDEIIVRYSYAMCLSPRLCSWGSAGYVMLQFDGEAFRQVINFSLVHISFWNIAAVCWRSSKDTFERAGVDGILSMLNRLIQTLKAESFPLLLDLVEVNALFCFEEVEAAVSVR